MNSFNIEGIRHKTKKKKNRKDHYFDRDRYLIFLRCPKALDKIRKRIIYTNIYVDKWEVISIKDDYNKCDLIYEDTKQNTDNYLNYVHISDTDTNLINE